MVWHNHTLAITRSLLVSGTQVRGGGCCCDQESSFAAFRFFIGNEQAAGMDCYELCTGFVVHAQLLDLIIRYACLVPDHTHQPEGTPAAKLGMG